MSSSATPPDPGSSHHDREVATSSVPGELFDDSRSAAQRYQDLFVGQRGLWPLIRYEAAQLLASWVPGALGLLLRRVFYQRLLGSCGRNATFGRNVVLRHPHKIHLGDNVAVDDNCVLDAKGERNEGIRIGSGVFIGRNTIVACKDGDLRLEDGVNISYNCAVFSGSQLRIGSNTLLAAYVYVIGGDHAHERTDVAVSQQQRLSAGIDIGSNCWLGAGARVLDGVTLGNDCIVGANSVVTRDAEPYTVVAGIPAKPIRDRRSAPAATPAPEDGGS